VANSNLVRAAHRRIAIVLGVTLGAANVAGFAQQNSSAPATPTPFSDFSGADYLNAVYSGRFDQVSAADAKYFEGYQALNSMVSQELSSMGLDTASTAFDPANYSLVVPVLTVYLMNYGQTSKSCLRPGFKEFVVNRTLVTTRELPWGGKIVESQGIVGVDRYPVNKEFIPAFSELGTSDPDERAVPDALLNGGQTNKLFSGIRSMMASIPCTDASIVRFERNLLSLYNNREANRQEVFAQREKFWRDRDAKRAVITRACKEELARLGIVSPFESDFIKRCEEDRKSISDADIARWKAGPDDIERISAILYGDNPRFTKAGTYIRQQHCERLGQSGGGDNGLRSMKCMLEYQPTAQELESIKMMDELKVRRGEKP